MMTTRDETAAYEAARDLAAHIWIGTDESALEAIADRLSRDATRDRHPRHADALRALADAMRLVAFRMAERGD